MIDLQFWKAFGSAACKALGILAISLSVIATLKAIRRKRAKPRILRIRKRTIDQIGDFTIELFIKNSGSKDCSLIEIELDWPKVIPWPKNSTFLPKPIAPGQTELIEIRGRAKKGTLSGIIALQFDNNKIIRRKIDFIVLSR